MLFAMFWMPAQINVWLDKSRCIESADKDCFCPHFNNYDYDSLFVGFDICLTSTSTINLQNYESYLEYSNKLTRDDISIGSYETYNITIDPDDFDLFDRNPTKRCIQKGSCKHNDIYAHIIVYDYPSANNKQRTYANFYTLKLTKHNFKEVVEERNGNIFTKLKHSIHIEDKINISYVTEHACFNRSYWGNNIIWQKILKREYNEEEQYVPIVTVYHQFSKISISKRTVLNLTLSFNPQSIFGFEIQNLLAMDAKTQKEAPRFAPELFFSFQLCKSFKWIFSLNGMDINACMLFYLFII